MKTKRWLYFSDVHIPYHDTAAVNWLLEQVREYKPDVLINGGDVIDADAASRFPNDTPIQLSHEYSEMNTLFKRLRESVPRGTQLVWCHGNHEDHILDPDPKRLDRNIRDLLHWDRHVPEVKHWKQIPYGRSRTKNAFSIGQVTFTHGTTVGDSGLKRDTVLYCVPYGLMINGHIHRPDEHVVQIMMNGVGLPYWRISSGCFMDMDVPQQYMRTKRMDQWGQGIVVGEAADLKSPRLSVMWDAHPVIRKMGPNALTLGHNRR